MEQKWCVFPGFFDQAGSELSQDSGQGQEESKGAVDLNMSLVCQVLVYFGSISNPNSPLPNSAPELPSLGTYCPETSWSSVVSFNSSHESSEFILFNWDGRKLSPNPVPALSVVPTGYLHYSICKLHGNILVCPASSTEFVSLWKEEAQCLLIFLVSNHLLPPQVPCRKYLAQAI